ncbi:LADA_0H00826g1_1 [Lachancea dasiensis]|uniref:LADA_0H00826g1_1 n=1 Tax=Lachancea dasiensis TaxID=1072105 RepID=A0A1G4JZ73_9SACH|nr:LADA_0H00826g1_1 [Lachancea dasiensis]
MLNLTSFLTLTFTSSSKIPIQIKTGTLMRSSVAFTTGLILSVGSLTSCYDIQQTFESVRDITRPHAVRVNIHHLDKRDTAPAFSSLQDEWSADVVGMQAMRFEKSTAVAEICAKELHNIESAGQLYQLQQSCRTLSGTLQISDFIDPVIDLGGLQNINGDFIVENLPDVVRIQAHNLATIGGTFKIDSLTSLTSIYFPVLHHFDAIEWKVVPTLTSLSLAPNISHAKRLTLSDTSLIGIDALERIEDLDILNINNNRFLEYVKSNVKQVNEQLSVSSNSKELRIDFPSLIWANNLTVRDVASVTFPQLQYVNQSFEVIENNFERFETPLLKTVGGTLGVIQNTHLSHIDFSNVTTIQGGLMIANNSNVDKIDFLPELREIGGAIQFIGTFHETVLPKLRLVRGSALVRTTSSAMDCSKWTTSINGNSVIRGGKIVCTSGQTRNTARVSEDGQLLDHHETQLDVKPDTIQKTSLASGTLDKSKLPAFAWSLSLGWIVTMICLVATQ